MPRLHLFARLAAVAAVALGSAACIPDLTGIGTGDGGGDGPALVAGDLSGSRPSTDLASTGLAARDLSSTDLRPVDLAVPDLAGADLAPGLADLASPPDLSPGCPRPHLLVLFEDNQFGGKARVERFSVRLGGLSPCDELTLGGTLPGTATALGFIPPNTIGVGDDSGTFFLDETTGYQQHTIYQVTGAQDENEPRDVFPLVNPLVNRGQPVIAIAYANPTDPRSGADHVEVTDGHTQLARWPLAAGSPLSMISYEGMRSATQSPYGAGTILFAPLLGQDPTPDAAHQIVAPFDGMAVRSTVALGEQAAPANTVYSFGPPAAGQQIAWAMVLHSFINDDQLYLVRDSGAGADPVGPLGCSNVCPAHTSYPHAAPDPTDPDSVFAICTDPSNLDQSWVVRVHLNGGCDEIFDSMSVVVTEPRIARLAIAQ